MVHAMVPLAVLTMLPVMIGIDRRLDPGGAGAGRGTRSILLARLFQALPAWRDRRRPAGLHLVSRLLHRARSPGRTARDDAGAAHHHAGAGTAELGLRRRARGHDARGGARRPAGSMTGSSASRRFPASLGPGRRTRRVCACSGSTILRVVAKASAVLADVVRRADRASGTRRAAADLLRAGPRVPGAAHPAGDPHRFHELAVPRIPAARIQLAMVRDLFLLARLAFRHAALLRRRRSRPRLLRPSIGGLAALALARSNTRWGGAVFATFLAPMIVPRIIIAVGLFYLFAQIGLVATDTGPRDRSHRPGPSLRLRDRHGDPEELRLASRPGGRDARRQPVARPCCSSRFRS